MPQKLMVEVTDSAGNKSTRTVNVVRSWQDAGGALIIMFHNGSYGYKNGEPVRNASEFNIISSPVQHKAALAWWERAGRELSEAYYAAKERREAELHGDYRAEIGSESQYDSVLYTRTPTDKPDDVSGPFSWMDLFNKRPDWWGQAQMIGFGDFAYRKAETAQAGPPATEPEAGADNQVDVSKRFWKGRKRTPLANSSVEE